MQRLKQNMMVSGRYLLIEEISFEAQKGLQVWSVIDTQTQERLIGRFWHNGQVEWFNDNRPVPISKPSAPPQNPTKIQSPASTPTNGKRVFYFFVLLLLLGGGAFGYLKKDVITDFYNKQISKQDSSAVEKTSVTAPSTANDSVSSPLSEFQMPINPLPPVTAQAESAIQPPSPVESLGWSPQEAEKQLKLLSSKPVNEHQRIFNEARKAFTELQKTSGNIPYIETLYVMCAGRGALSLQAHQQNGDDLSKFYGVEWYKLAFALKPTAELGERIERMTRRKRVKPTQNAINRKGNSLFMKDPEIK